MRARHAPGLAREADAEVGLRVRDWRHFLAFLILAAALFWGGAQPGAGRLFAPPWDKLAHCATFFVMTLLLGRGVRMPLAAVGLAVLAIGAGDEWHQRHLTTRVASGWDLLADAAGIVLALLWLRCRRSGENG